MNATRGRLFIARHESLGLIPILHACIDIDEVRLGAIQVVWSQVCHLRNKSRYLAV